MREREDSCPSRGHSPPPSQLCLVPGASFRNQDTGPLFLPPFTIWGYGFQWQPPERSCPPVPVFLGIFTALLSKLVGPSCLLSGAQPWLPIRFLPNSYFPELDTWDFPWFSHSSSGPNSSDTPPALHSCGPPHPQPSPCSPGLGRTQDLPTQPRGNVTLRELSHVSVVSGFSQVTWEKWFLLWRFKMSSSKNCVRHRVGLRRWLGKETLK